VEAFWLEVASANKDNYILIQLQIRSGATYNSLSKLRKITYVEEAATIKSFTFTLHALYEKYTQITIHELYIRYKVRAPPPKDTLEGVMNPLDLLTSKDFKPLTETNLPIHGI
jgi:hypothetical protein